MDGGAACDCVNLGEPRCRQVLMLESAVLGSPVGCDQTWQGSVFRILSHWHHCCERTYCRDSTAWGNCAYDMHCQLELTIALLSSPGVQPDRPAFSEGTVQQFHALISRHMISCRSLAWIPVDKPYPLRWTLPNHVFKTPVDSLPESTIQTERPSQSIVGNPFSKPVIACCASNMLRCTARILIDTWLCTVHPPTLSKTLYNNSFVLCSQATATCTNKVFFYFKKLIQNQEGRRGCFDLWEFGQLLGSLVCSWRLLAAPVGMKFAVWWENSFGDGRRG